MTIDPSDFVKQGKPTVEQVREVWDAHHAPSARVIADLMQRRGWEIHWRTVARYHASDWTRKSGPRKKLDPERAELDRALARVQATIEKPRQAPPPPKEEPKATEAEPEPVAAATPEPVKVDPEQEAFDKRDAELMAQSENALRKIEAKRRLVTNIHIMEAMSKKAKVLVLVPKETGALVTSMTEAASAPTSSGKADSTMPQPGDNAHDVTPPGGHPTGNGKIIDVTPNHLSPVADSIARFRQKLGR